MTTPKDRIIEAYQWAGANLPKVNSYPYLAEALRTAGVLRYTVNLPSGHTMFFTNEGHVVSQSDVLLKGISEVPKYNQEAFLAVLRKTQAGEITFPEFLKGS